MGTLNEDLSTIKLIEDTLTSNKVANFAYTEEAYANNDADGVTEYDIEQDQNIPVATASVLKVNNTILTKGWRAQASSLTRMLMNHFLGRLSYNLNKINDNMSSLLSTLISHRGTANGFATLDENGRVPYAQLPESAMTYEGQWDASTNTPTLADGTGTQGSFYIVSVAGTQNLGSGNIQFFVNDRVIYDGSVWARLSAGDVKTVNNVSPVNGNVTLTKSDIGLGNVVNSGDSDIPEIGSGSDKKFTAGGAYNFFKEQDGDIWLNKVFHAIVGKKWNVNADTYVKRIWSYVWSPRARYLLIINSDNNLVYYKHASDVISGKSGKSTGITVARPSDAQFTTNLLLSPATSSSLYRVSYDLINNRLTFTSLSVPSDKALSKVVGLSSYIFLASTNKIYKTADEGGTWTTILTASYTINHLSGNIGGLMICCTSSSSAGKVYISTTLFSTYTEVSSSVLSASYLYYKSFFAGNKWFISSSNGLYYTISPTTATTSWSLAQGLPSGGIVQDIVEANGILVARLTGATKNIYYSTTGGTTWVVAKSVSTAIANVIDLKIINDVWYALTTARIWRSTDGQVWYTVFNRAGNDLVEMAVHEGNLICSSASKLVYSNYDVIESLIE